MEPVKEGPSWAICQLGVRGDQSAAVHGDGQALGDERALVKDMGKGGCRARSPPQVMLHHQQESQHCQGTLGWSTEHSDSELEISASLAIFLNLHLAEAVAHTEFSDKPTKPGHQLNTVTSVFPPLCSTGQPQCTQGCTGLTRVGFSNFLLFLMAI